jgi:mono/diheme cytochrome c family protein
LRLHIALAVDDRIIGVGANPLPRTRETVDHGAAVYDQSCASCHGATGEGDGEAGRNLSPPPANRAWLSQMPMAQWDPFIYWTVAEGGAQFGTAMPAYKDVLSSDDIGRLDTCTAATETKIGKFAGTERFASSIKVWRHD